MQRYHRKVIKITALDSPNVALALAQQAAGLTPTGEVIIPGVLPWADYLYRLATWDPIRISVGLHAEFYEGSEVLLYPPNWLTNANRVAEQLRQSRSQQPHHLPQLRTLKGKGIGVDPAEGGDRTSMACVDEFGLLELTSWKTPDTSLIIKHLLGFMNRHSVPPHRVLFDRGGGGKQLADLMRSRGLQVRTIAFGGTPTKDKGRTRLTLSDKRNQTEERSAYRNCRAEMYGTLRHLLDPNGEGVKGVGGSRGFGLPAEYTELRRQLAAIPLLYDGEGRLELPPKNRRSSVRNSERATLYDLLGCSPDEADALVLAIHAMLEDSPRPAAGAFFSHKLG